MRLLAVVVEVGERELRSVLGQLHREAGVDAVGALPIHKSKALGVSRGKHGGDLSMDDISKERANLTFSGLHLFKKHER